MRVFSRVLKYTNISFELVSVVLICGTWAHGVFDNGIGHCKHVYKLAR